MKSIDRKAYSFHFTNNKTMIIFSVLLYYEEFILCDMKARIIKNSNVKKRCL